MIPDNINSDHILKAIDVIKTNMVDENRDSTLYDLYFEGKTYPPKLTISKANLFANGLELQSVDFNGGEESHNFLISRGFPILYNKKKDPEQCFTKEDLDFFDQYANHPYDSNDLIHKNAGDYISTILWRRSREWADRIASITPFERKGKITWNEQRNNKKGQAFKYYSWYRLHHGEHYHDKVFYTVGIESTRDTSYKKSNLVIKLDCRRAKLDPSSIIAFDALLAERGVHWEKIPIVEKIGIGWDTLINRSLTFIDQTFKVYLDAIEVIENRLRDMAARLAWNENDWVSPSGPYGKSKTTAESQERDYGFTTEEWLFDFEKLLDGYHYGRLESLNAPHHVGQQYDITLFTNNSEEAQWYWVGKIVAAEVISPEMSEIISNEYRQRGWLDDQFNQLRQLNNVNVQNWITWADDDRFNVRFKIEDYRSYDLSPFALGENPPSGHYNLPTLKQEPAFLTEVIDVEDDIILGNQDEEGPKSKIKRQYRQQVLELENVHRHVQIGFAKYLRANRPDDHKIYTESYKRVSKTRVDIIEVTPAPNSIRIYYEVKTYSSSKQSIRAALGQLFEYSYFPKQKQTDVFVIVSHLPATANEIEYLKHLGNEFGIKLSYVCFDWKTEFLIEQ